MKKKQKKEKKNQIVEIHIYIHQNPQFQPQQPYTPTNPTPYTQPPGTWC